MRQEINYKSSGRVVFSGPHYSIGWKIIGVKPNRVVLQRERKSTGRDLNDFQVLEMHKELLDMLVQIKCAEVRAPIDQPETVVPVPIARLEDTVSWITAKGNRKIGKVCYTDNSMVGTKSGKDEEIMFELDTFNKLVKVGIIEVTPQREPGDILVDRYGCKYILTRIRGELFLVRLTGEGKGNYIEYVGLEHWKVGEL